VFCIWWSREKSLKQALSLVDGDRFFVKQQDNDTFVICEYMQGFAQLVLQKFKASDNNDEHLRFVIGSGELHLYYKRSLRIYIGGHH
jgi:hypothetical protein